MIPHFLPQGPALVVEDALRVLVIADLHIGTESALALRGFHIPSSTAGRLERAEACAAEAEPDVIVLLGDVKESVPLTSRQEYRELPGFLDSLRAHAPVRVVPGNHDGGIGRFLEEGELLPVRGAVIDGTGYLHGHTIPGPELMGHLIVTGHHHPVVHLYDEVGCSLRAHPAYLLAELGPGCPGIEEPPGGEKTRALFVPAFCELCGGVDVRELPGCGLGPLSRCISVEDAEVFLSDGTYIDTLEALKREADTRTA